MLKIKDNVDLKELEKFGLKPLYDCNTNTGEVHIRCIVSERYSGEYGALTLIPKKKKKGLHIFNRSISNNNDSLSFYYFDDGTYIDIDLLYDLIKSDLVDKVE